MKNEGNRIFQSIVRLFYPPLCVVCKEALVRGEKYLCSPCLADFPLADPAYQSVDIRLLIEDEVVDVGSLYALFYYNKYNDYKNLVYAVKYRSGKELCVYLGRMLGGKIGDRSGVHAIVPIPLHPKREKRRGYNQARQIALGMAEAMKVPLWDDIVCRVQDNASQTGKSAGERQKNVENIFRLKKTDVLYGKHLLVVDDVITTGATIKSCIRTLAEAGHVRFSLACLARTEV